jgi:hypothetical protein
MAYEEKPQNPLDKCGDCDHRRMRHKVTVVKGEQGACLVGHSKKSERPCDCSKFKELKNESVEMTKEQRTSEWVSKFLEDTADAYQYSNMILKDK